MTSGEKKEATADAATGPLLVHAADSHLDFKNKQVQQLNELGRNVREYDFWLAFEFLVNAVLAMESRPRAFLVAGDLFSTPRPINAVFKALVSLLNRLEEAGIETLIIGGNHDTPQMHVTTSAFESLMEIQYEHIHFAYDTVERVVLEDTEFVLVPHLALVRGVEPDSLRPDRSSARYSVLVTHGVAAGNDLFRQLDEQREVALSEYLLTLGHDYVALGHHHKRSRPLPGVWYSGSLENTSFGKDATDLRGALLVDLAAMAADPVAYEPPLLEVPVRPLVEPQALDLTGLPAAAVEAAVRKALDPYELAGAMVRLTVRGITKDTYDSVDRSGLLALGREALSFNLNWELRQVQTQLGGGSAEGIRSLDLEFADAVDAYYAARGDVPLPDKQEVLERGQGYLRTFMEAEAETDV